MGGVSEDPCRQAIDAGVTVTLPTSGTEFWTTTFVMMGGGTQQPEFGIRDASLARIHRRRAWGLATEAGKGCSSESGIMVWNSKPIPDKEHPIDATTEQPRPGPHLLRRPPPGGPRGPAPSRHSRPPSRPARTGRQPPEPGRRPRAGPTPATS